MSETFENVCSGVEREFSDPGQSVENVVGAAWSGCGWSDFEAFLLGGEGEFKTQQVVLWHVHELLHQ